MVLVRDGGRRRDRHEMVPIKTGGMMDVRLLVDRDGISR